MTQIGLFYGSTNGNTARIARLIQTKLEAALAGSGAAVVELFDLAEDTLEEADACDFLILGVPTWNTGQLQRDWERAIDEFDALDLHGKRIAVFGLGDQAGYPDTFADAIFFVADQAQRCGGTLAGRWPAAGYAFRSSWACEGDLFLGLVLDEDNQPELTDGRLDAWLAQVLGEFGLA
jgi:flavodoxin I